MTVREQPSLEERIRMIYDVYDEIASRELGDDEMRDLELTDQVVDEIVDEVRWAFGRRRNATSMVRSVLSNSNRWSPHVDWIAVERAANFDWGAFERLTVADRAALGEVLSAMGNWNDVHPRDGLHRTSSGADSVVKPTDRRMAYMRSTQKQRDRLANIVKKARDDAQTLAA